MNPFNLQNKSWRQRVFLVLTIVLLVVLASHPELRVFLPLVDALGLDLLLVLMGAQLWDYVRPMLLALYTRVLRPASATVYSLTIFFLGIIGPYLDAQVAAGRMSRHTAT
jgi:hypothetical protein